MTDSNRIDGAPNPAATNVVGSLMPMRGSAPEALSVVSVRREGDAQLAVGSRAVVTRRVGRRELPTTAEVAALNPPRSWAVRGVGGSVIAIAKGTIEPLDDGERSRVTIALDFEAHGIGKLLVPLIIRWQARRQLPRNEQKLKELLERGA